MSEARDRRWPAVQEWEARGLYRRLCGHSVFTIDLPAAGEDEAEPLLILHGYPTCSFDFHGVVTALNARRRVLLLDMVGYGLSAKPDIAYTLDLQADVVVAFLADAGVSRVALLTHDMGDTVGGELLARQAEGRWPVDVTRRVVTNGSVYIEMAHLSPGQQFLLALPDKRMEDTEAPDAAALEAGLAQTFSPHSDVPKEELAAQWELVSHNDGHLLLARTIRYIEERHRSQARYTGAIERHPSPLAVVWGTDDPIAVALMAERLAAARPGTSLTWLPDVGHYLMIEAPERFLAAVQPELEG